jgi:glutamine synthetase
VTPRSLMATCREKGVRCAEVRYVDLSGRIDKFFIPVDRVSEELFELGIPFEGAREGHGSPKNQTLIPLASTAYIAPFRSSTTLVMLAELQDPLTRRENTLDPRAILQKAAEAWKSNGLCDRVTIGQTCEVLLLKSLQVDQSTFASSVRIEPLSSSEDFAVTLPSKSDPNKSTFIDGGSRTWSEGGSPDISTFCAEVLQHLLDVGIVPQHAAASGQAAGLCRFELAPVEPTQAADNQLLTCEIIRATAQKYGLTACFLPSIGTLAPPLGWNLQLSAFKENDSIIAGTKQFELSDRGASIAAGIIQHVGSLLAITSPTVASFDRLSRIANAAKRSQLSSMLHPFVSVNTTASPLTDRSIDVRMCDQTCNPYLAIASLLMAGLSGLEENKSLEGIVGNPSTHSRLFPTTLDRALVRLKLNHDFLLAHDVFTITTLKAWSRFIRNHRLNSRQQSPSASDFLKGN